MECLLVSIKCSLTWDRRGLNFVFIRKAITGISELLYCPPYEDKIQRRVFTLSDFDS